MVRTTPITGKRTSEAGDKFPELADLAYLLDSRWRIPGLGIRFGVDALLSLIPFVGDLAAGAISASIIFRAHELGVSRMRLMRMVGNVVLDVAIGSVPIAGSVFDLFFKANNANIKLLRRHLAEQGRRLPPPLPEQQSEDDVDSAGASLL